MTSLLDDIGEAYNLIKDIEPTSPNEYILKGVVNATMGQDQGSVSKQTALCINQMVIETNVLSQLTYTCSKSSRETLEKRCEICSKLTLKTDFEQVSVSWVMIYPV